MSARLYFLAGFVICASAIGFALYVQHVIGLEPCPLCIFQRVAVMALGLIFLIATLHNPGVTGRRIYSGLLFIAALVGAGISTRHLWLQYGPHEELACGGSLEFMLDTLPFHQVLMDVFKGTGDCANIDWTLFGLSMPGWTLMGFLAAAAYAVFIARLQPKRGSWVD